MKKRLAKVGLVLALGILSGCESSATNLVKTGGSSSVEKVMNALIYQFQDLNREITINYEMNGSGDGIKNTGSGVYEIGHSSRELTKEEEKDGLVATAYAWDGIAVVLHKDNKIKNLAPAQLRDIYTGKIKNWQEIGGEDHLITVVTREASSGTRQGFAEIIGLEKKADPKTDIVSSATTCDTTGAVQTTVAQNKNAIGYMSFSDINKEKVNTVKVNQVQISMDSLQDDSYPLKRKFYLITKKGKISSPAAKSFLDFVKSAAGQKIMYDNKLVALK